MGRKKKSKVKSNLITEYLDYKAEDEVIYTRISDGKQSLGIIKYFHLGTTACATVIDLQLGNYQTAIVEDIVKEPTKELMNSMWSKIAGKSKRRKKS